MTARRIFPAGLILCLVLTPRLGLSAAAEPDPANTYAVICGVLSWQSPSLSSFPTKDRKDKELYEALLELGVPEKNMVLLLDKQATAARMLGGLQNVARRAKSGSTFIFYYAGHGTKKNAKTYFCNYDYVSARAPQTGFAVDRIATTLARHFKGERIFLMADCCYSGSLGAVAEKLSRSGLKTCALTSAAASNVSTSNWTFTQTVIDAIRGDPLMDVNEDGAIQLAEAAWAVKEAMQYCERQFFGYAIYGLSTRFPVTETSGQRPKHNEIPKPYAFGQYVYAMPRSTWRRGRVMDYKDQKYAVRLQYYSQRPTVWLPPDKIKQIRLKKYPLGTNLTVLWKRKEWKARVIKVAGDFHMITYPGYSSDWDEWVLSNRIVGVYEEIARKAKVQIKRGGKWHPGIVLKTRRDEHLVHYTGFDTADDKWVTAERIRSEPSSAALQKASCGGKYSTLLRVIKVEDDVKTYSTFRDYGYYETTSWGGHTNLPPGYWVYVYPNWYIWRDQENR